MNKVQISVSAAALIGTSIALVASASRCNRSHLLAQASRTVRLLRWKAGLGTTFHVRKAHVLAASKEEAEFCAEADRLVQSLLNGSNECSQSSDDLPCSYVALATSRGGTMRVAGHVRLSSASSTDLSKLRKMVQMGMIRPAKQNCAVNGISEEVVDLLAPGREVPPGLIKRQAYLSSLVVAPEYQGLGLGKALARVATAHAAQIGCTSVVGMAANAGLVPFYEKLGALAESSRPVQRRRDIPKVKVGHSRALTVELEDFQGRIESHVLRELPEYVALAR